MDLILNFLGFDDGKKRLFSITLLSNGKPDNLNSYKKLIYNILSVILNSVIWWIVPFKPIISKYFSTTYFWKNLEMNRVSDAIGKNNSRNSTYRKTLSKVIAKRKQFYWAQLPYLLRLLIASCLNRNGN